MEAKPGLPEAPAAALAEAAALQAAYGALEPLAVIERAAVQFWTGEMAAISSFGADSAVLLHMVSRVDRAIPVIFLDTGKHFEETLRYRDDLIADLGLTDLRIVEPGPAALSAADPDGLLHRSDVEACCEVRKVEPMARAVEPFRSWLTGRKRFQASTRAALPAFEAVGPRLRINPLASWSADDIARYAADNGLRPNPLVAYGYLSIGCFPCTRPVQPGEDARAGRWAGQAKTECGIHLGGIERPAGASRLQGTDA